MWYRRLWPFSSLLLFTIIISIPRLQAQSAYGGSAAAGAEGRGAKSPLSGAWELAYIKRTLKDGTVRMSAPPEWQSILIFTDDAYCYALEGNEGDTRSFISNAGTYKIVGDNFITTNRISNVPSMKGTSREHHFEIQGNEMVWKETREGVVTEERWKRL